MSLISCVLRFFVALTLVGVLSACSLEAEEVASGTLDVENQQTSHWAINVGGPRLVSSSGELYDADIYTQDCKKSSSRVVKASQSPEIFETLCVGDIGLSRKLDNGVYTLSFEFIEPSALTSTNRLFDVYVEGNLLAKDVNLVAMGGGQRQTAVTHSWTGVVVEDGQLDVSLRSRKGKPVLAGLKAIPEAAKKDSWNLVWQENFDSADGLDPEYWNIQQWPAGKVNNESQRYTDSNDNVRIENGRLVLEAHHANDEYTSGRVHTKGKVDVLYGRVEVRAKLPQGKGTWPAIWMLPSDPYRYAESCRGDEDIHGNSDCDAWPNSGEIDIMEHVGYELGRVHATVHTKAYYWVNQQQRRASITGGDVSNSFSDYVLEWSPERIDMYMDDVLYFSYVNEGKDWTTWPFDHPYHLILNLAVGGDWGAAGGGIDASAFPTRMEVDHVKIYERASQASDQLADSE